MGEGGETKKMDARFCFFPYLFIVWRWIANLSGKTIEITCWQLFKKVTFLHISDHISDQYPLDHVSRVTDTCVWAELHPWQTLLLRSGRLPPLSLWILQGSGWTSVLSVPSFLVPSQQSRSQPRAPQGVLMFTNFQASHPLPRYPLNPVLAPFHSLW